MAFLDPSRSSTSSFQANIPAKSPLIVQEFKIKFHYKILEKILSLPRIGGLDVSAIDEAVALTVCSIEDNQFEGTRLFINVSGNGPNTLAPPIEAVRAGVMRR